MIFAISLPAAFLLAQLQAAPHLTRFEFTQAQMGVPFRIILHAENQEHGTQAAKAAFARISELNAVLSNYETDSELSQLGYQSGSQGWTPTSADLFRILVRAQRLAQLTDGAFDLTIGPLAASWRNARRTKAFPDVAQLDRFRARVGWQHVKLNHSRQQVRLSIPGMRLDPGGIAKGDALDQALQSLRQNGISQALVAGAGDIAVSDSPPGREAWRIQLSDFNTKAKLLPALVNLENQAIATSGDLFQFVEIDGKRYSHIVDPKTGLGLTERRLVSVIAPDGMTADSLATALSVVDFDKIENILRYFPGSAARILTLEGDQQTESTYGRFPRFQAEARE